MTRALIVTAEGVSDIHLPYLYHRLREDAILVDVVSPEGGQVVGEHGLTWNDTTSFTELDHDYGIIFIPGGSTADTLANHEPAIDLLTSHIHRGRTTGAIGRGVTFLGDVGIPDETLVTGPSNLSEHLTSTGLSWTGDRVTIDGSIVTAGETSDLPFFTVAVCNTHTIPQDSAMAIENRNTGERPRWET